MRISEDGNLINCQHLNLFTANADKPVNKFFWPIIITTLLTCNLLLMLWPIFFFRLVLQKRFLSSLSLPWLMFCGKIVFYAVAPLLISNWVFFINFLHNQTLKLSKIKPIWNIHVRNATVHVKIFNTRLFHVHVLLRNCTCSTGRLTIIQRKN